MKEKTIKLFATQIPYTEEELEENVVYVQFDLEELFDQIESSDIYDYAVNSLHMVDKDSFESSLDDFDEDELVEELESRGHNFSKQIGEEDCIDFLEDSGYTVSEYKEDVYDYIDNCLFEEISSVFYNLSCTGRQELRDLVINNFK